MYHLRNRRLQIRAALKVAVQERNASEILNLYQEAEAVGVAQNEIDEALDVAAKIFAPSAYKIAMQGGSAVDMIHCLGCISHLSSEQTAQLEMRIAEEALLLIRKGHWACVRDLLRAAELAGVSSLRDPNGEKSVGLMIQETYADEAMEGADADAISEACAALEGTSSDRDLSEMRARVEQIRARRHDRSGDHTCFCFDTYPEGCDVLRTEGKRLPFLSLDVICNEEMRKSHTSISSVSTAASESLTVLHDSPKPTAAAC
jgi:hypothetical protein